MVEWLVCVVNGTAAGMLAAASGFAGSFVLLWASWRSVGIREALLNVETIDTTDQTLKEAAVILAQKLNQDQLAAIRGERRLYLIGVSLLAVAFALSFLRELV
ncbi:MAG: hypothetical protein ACFCUO_12190 [Rhodospirillales bacterium]